MPRRNKNARGASDAQRKAQQPKQPNRQPRCEHAELIPWGSDSRYSYCANCGKHFATETVAPRARIRFTRSVRLTQAQAEQLDMWGLLSSVDLSQAMEALDPEGQTLAEDQPEGQQDQEGTSHGE